MFGNQPNNPGADWKQQGPLFKTAGLGLLVKLPWLSGDVGKSAALGLPVQRAAFRPAALPTFRRGARGAATGRRALKSAISKQPPGYLAPAGVSHVGWRE
jgi:hypothetical protein